MNEGFREIIWKFDFITGKQQLTMQSYSKLDLTTCDFYYLRGISNTIAMSRSLQAFRKIHECTAAEGTYLEHCLPQICLL